MKKVFIEPKMSVVELDGADIIATSTGGTVPSAPWKSRQLSDDDFYDEDIDE